MLPGIETEFDEQLMSYEPDVDFSGWADDFADGFDQDDLPQELRTSAYECRVTPVGHAMVGPIAPVPVTQGSLVAPNYDGTPNHTISGAKLEPVNSANGEFYMERADLEFPGFGVPFQHSRTYRSRIDYDGPLGHGWDFSYNRRLLVVPEPRLVDFQEMAPPASIELEGLYQLPVAIGAVGVLEAVGPNDPPPYCGPQLVYTTGRGTTLLFREVGSTSTDVVYESATLRRLHGHRQGEVTTWTLEDPDGTVERFDSNGLLTRVEDANGVGLEVSWEQTPDETWRLARVTDSVGRIIEYHHDDDGRLIQVAEAGSGLHLEYVYDGNGDLVQATDSRGNTETYEYDFDQSRAGGNWGPEWMLRRGCELACAPSEASCDAGGACDQLVAQARGQCRNSCGECAEGCFNECQNPLTGYRHVCQSGSADDPALVGCKAGCQSGCAGFQNYQHSLALLECDQLFFESGAYRTCGDCETACEQADSACEVMTFCVRYASEYGGGPLDQDKYEACLAGNDISSAIDQSLELFAAAVNAVGGALECTLGLLFCSWNPWCDVDCDFDGAVTAFDRACDRHYRLCCRDGEDCTADSCNAGHGCYDDCVNAFYGEEVVGVDGPNNCLAPDYVNILDPHAPGPYPGDPEFEAARKVDDWAAENGCVPQKMGSCVDVCARGCLRDCNVACSSACQAECDDVCHVADCDGYCDSLDLMGACQEGCVAGCVDGAHENGPIVGAKYGYPRDLNHNLVHIFDGNGVLYLENEYGADLGSPDFDAVVHQQFGEWNAGLHYRDLAGETEGFVSPPAGGPADDFAVGQDAFETVEICPSTCSENTPLATAEYVGWEEILLVFEDSDGVAGGLPVVSRYGNATAEPTLLFLEQASGAIIARASSEGLGSRPMRERLGRFEVELDQGRVTFSPTGSQSFIVEGKKAARKALLDMGQVTILTDSERRLLVYPGQPSGLAYVASGSCSRPFRATKISESEMVVEPAEACTDELVVTPLATAVNDPATKQAYSERGSEALVSSVFAANVLASQPAVLVWRTSDKPGARKWRVPGKRGVQVWHPVKNQKEKDQNPDADVGLSPASYRIYVRSGAPSTAAARAARFAAVNVHRNLPLAVLPQADNDFAGPLYVFHDAANRPDPQHPDFGGVELPLSPAVVSLPRRTCALDEIGRQDVYGVRSWTPAAKPTRATVVVDFYGVAWTYYFDEGGRVVRLVNNSTGSVRSMNYDEVGQLQGIALPGGDRVCFSYDDRGNVTDEVHFPVPTAVGSMDPVTWHYSYTQSPSRLASVSDPRGGGTLQTFTWDEHGNLTSVISALGDTVTFEAAGGTGPTRGMPIRRVDPDGSVSEVEYDELRGTIARIIEDAGGSAPVVHEMVSDSAGRSVWAKGPLGAVAMYDWVGGRLTTLTSEAGGLGDQLMFSYDGDGQVTSVAREDRSTSIAYDLTGGIRSITNKAKDGSAAAATTCTRRGPTGRLIEAVYPEGNRVRYAYDGEGRVVDVFAGAWSSGIASWDDACNAYTGGVSEIGVLGSVDYDFGGRPVVVTNAMGVTQEIEYDGFGRPAIATDALGTTYRTGYDELGNPIWRSIYAASSGVPYGPPLQDDPGLLAAMDLDYDAAGRLVGTRAWHFDEETGAPIGDGFATTRYLYDLSAGTLTVIDDKGSTTTYRRDGAGRLVRVDYPTGDHSTTEYLDGGRTVVRSQTAATPSGIASARLLLTEWGEVASVESTDAGGSAVFASRMFDDHRRLIATGDASGQGTSYQYDAFDRLRTQKSSYGDSGAEILAYAWDRNGWLRERSSVSGIVDAVTRYDYDAFGRVTHRKAPDGSTTYSDYMLASGAISLFVDESGVEFHHSYGPTGLLGRVRTVAPGAGLTQWREYYYDDLSRLTQTRRAGEMPGWAPAQVNTYQAWDSLSNKTAESDDSFGVGGGHHHVHDGLGLIELSDIGATTIRRKHDALGRLQAVLLNGEESPAVELGYDGLGGPTLRSDGSSVTTSFEYDAFGRLNGMSNQHVSLGEIARWRWEIPLDGAPRLAGLTRPGAMERASVFTTSVGGALESETHNLKGSGTFQLAPDAETAAANALADGLVGKSDDYRLYTLDPRHNWLAVTRPGSVTEFSVDAADAYAMVGGFAPEYDARGALLEDETTSYGYDSFGELVWVSGSGSSREMVRDALGRVVLERDAATGDITRYAYDGGRRTLRKSPSGAVDVTVDGAGLDEHLVRVDASGERYYYHQDRMGSVYLITGDDGTPVESYDYTAYGEVRIFDAAGEPIATSAIGNRFGYQGHPYDPATGLVDMRLRTYSPRWGRFLTRDPIGYLGGTNLYAFVDSAPLLWTDPWGLDKVGGRGSILDEGEVQLVDHYNALGAAGYGADERRDAVMNVLLGAYEQHLRAQDPDRLRVGQNGFADAWRSREPYFAEGSHLGSHMVNLLRTEMTLKTEGRSDASVVPDMWFIYQKELNPIGKMRAPTYILGAMGVVTIPGRAVAFGRALGASGDSAQIGAARGGGSSAFNAAKPGVQNCVGAVCAFLKSVQSKRLFRATGNVADNQGRISRALGQVEDNLGARFGEPQFNTLDRVGEGLFVVFRGSNPVVSDHIAVGIVTKNGRTLIFDPQTGQKFLNPADFGSFIAYPLVFR